MRRNNRPKRLGVVMIYKKKLIEKSPCRWMPSTKLRRGRSPFDMEIQAHNSFARIVKSEDKSIDNPSTKPNNLSTGRRPMPRNNQTTFRLYTRIFRSSFYPALSKSPDNRQTFCLIRPIIVSRSAVIVRRDTYLNRPIINRQVVKLCDNPWR